jgi:excisionase family DNA binding protein
MKMSNIKKTTTIAEEFMTVDELAREIGLSVGTIRKMCHYKQIPYHKWGRAVRFFKPDIKKWVMAKKAA